MELLRGLAGPVVGAVIGYITNDIAIRMLFRPHRAIYILGFRLPFTPGIVPRRKDQLAKILGDAIVEKFFNADDLERIFTSGIADPVARAVTELLQSDLTLNKVELEFPSGAVDQLERELCVRIQAAVCLSNLPEEMAREGGKMASRLMGDGAGQRLTEYLADSLTGTLAHEIREFVIEHGQTYILPLVKREVERLSDAPLGDLTALLGEGKESLLHEAVKRLYLRFMAKHVRPIVESIDVGGMITEKIILMTSEEVEDLVLTVVRRELRLVVWFGAFLGALIGAVNIFL